MKRDYILVDYVYVYFSGRYQHFEGMYCPRLQGRGLEAEAFFETTYVM